MEVILKDGKYTSKELCELCKYDYNNFRKRKTLIDKLSKVCKVTKIKENCNKVYWVLENSNGVKFDAMKRKEHDMKHKATDEYEGKNKKYKNILTDTELREGFDGYYVYAHYIDNEVIYIGKGCRSRCIKDSGRKYKIEDLTDIKILKRFKDEEQALKYEEYMIDFYQLIGQCKYNDNYYHEGGRRDKSKEETLYNKLVSEMVKLENKKEKLQNKILDIDKKIEKIQNKLDNLKKE